MGHFDVEIPGGGTLSLQSADEKAMWDDTAKGYIDDYGFSKANDLALLGAILSQKLVMFRAQLELAANDSEKGSQGSAQSRLMKASSEIRELEKSLGIDKKSRESGSRDLGDYVSRLKLAAHERGVHLARMLKEMEGFRKELSWKLRLLRQGDDEDRAYHSLTPASVIEWCERELDRLEELDKEWANEKGKVWLGRL